MSRGIALFITALVLSLVVTSVASAQSKIYQCNGCTAAQTSDMAQKLGMGNHLIGDFTNNVLWAYSVTREPAGGGKYTYEVDPGNVTALQQQAFGYYYQLLTTYHGSSIIVIVPNPPNRPQGWPQTLDGYNAIQWASTTNPTNQLDTYMTELQGGTIDKTWMPPPAVIALFAMQSGLTVDSYTTSLQFTLVNSDGSIVKWTWTNGSLTLNSIVDRYGNTVPIKNFNGATNFNGSYTVPANIDPVYYNQLVNYLNTLGAGLSALTSPGGTIAIVCVGAKCTVTQPN